MSQKKKESPRPEQPSCSSPDAGGRRNFVNFRSVVLEVMKFRKFNKYLQPILEPLVSKAVEKQIGLVKQEIMASMKGNKANKDSTSALKKLKLQFRNKVSLPTYTGKCLLGENGTTIQIALVDTVTEQIVNTGPESMAKLEIVGFRVADNESNDDSWTFEDFHKRILSEKKGNRTLQGNTCLQLKEGVCLVDKISFTHNRENKINGLYRLGVGVVDAALMNEVEVATTEAFLMKDRRAIYSEKYSHPCLSDKVCHLQQIRYKGIRYKRLKDAGVITVKDLLTLLYIDPNQLEKILGVTASSKIWGDIVKNAQASNGMFLCLDPSNERNTGVVLNVKLQLKALIVEPHRYLPVDRLSDKEKVDNQNLVEFAYKNFKMLPSFEDETSLIEYLQLVIGFTSLPSANQSLDGPPIPSSHVTYSTAPDNLNESNHSPIVRSQSELGKGIVAFDDEMIYSKNFYQEHISSYQATLESPNGLNSGAARQPGMSSQVVGSLDTCGVTDTSIFSQSLEDSEKLDRLLSKIRFSHNNWDYRKEKDSLIPRRLQLLFLSRLALPIFTGTRIEGGDSNTLKIALIDAYTGKTVSSGTESSATVEIVVLEGDFDSNEGDSWTLEEFNYNVVRERQGKKPLLTGNALLNLSEGIGLVGDLSFRDNSSWTRSRKFRLGARVLDIGDGDRVREAKSESFVVRDHRGELYKKHHPPYLTDEVWRLEKIGKEGAFHKRLNKEKIKTVKDFLALSFLDPAKLRNILGSGMSTKMWDVTMDHARRCVIDDKKLYLYCPPSRNGDGVVFNVVGRLLGLLSNCKYVVADKLLEVQRAEAHKLVISAFQNSEHIVAYDDEASLRAGTCSISEDIYPLNTQMVTSDPEGSKMRNSHKKGRSECLQISALSPQVNVMPTFYPVGGVDSYDEYGINSMVLDDLRFDHDLPLRYQVPDTLICDSFLNSHDGNMQYFGTSSSQVDLQCAVDGFFFPHSAISKAQRRWKIVFSVLKWLSLMLEIRKRDIIKFKNPE